MASPLFYFLRLCGEEACVESEVMAKWVHAFAGMTRRTVFIMGEQYLRHSWDKTPAGAALLLRLRLFLRRRLGLRRLFLWLLRCRLLLRLWLSHRGFFQPDSCDVTRHGGFIHEEEGLAYAYVCGFEDKIQPAPNHVLGGMASRCHPRFLGKELGVLSTTYGRCQ